MRKSFRVRLYTCIEREGERERERGRERERERERARGREREQSINPNGYRGEQFVLTRVNRV
jgi:hypothetical protein